MGESLGMLMEGPGGFVAYLDSVEELDRGGVRLVFDLMGAAMVGVLRELEDEEDRFDAVVTQPTLIVEADFDQHALGSVSGLRLEDLTEDSGWFGLRLGHRGHPALAYPDPVAPVATPSSIQGIYPLTNAEQEELSSLVSMSNVPDASSYDLLRALPPQIGLDVHVYNVGQGNCQALVDENRMPVLYFDLGRGVRQHAATAPQDLRFCFTNEPGVVLSHWDMDHWAAGWRNRQAQSRPWVVPRQPMGATHLRMAAMIRANGQLLVLPRTLAGFAWGMSSFFQLGGRGRNESGIVADLRVRDGRSALLPADASYARLHSTLGGGRVMGLVASHHGGRAPGTPPGPLLPDARLAFSYGDPNHYGHPRTRNDHSAVGWRVSRTFDTPNGGVALFGPSNVPLACGGRHCTTRISQS